MNNISVHDFLPGAQEAEAFENREYVKLHQSTLRKVEILAHIFERTADKRLKTNASWADQNGFHAGVVVEAVEEHWLWTLFVMIAVVVSVIAAVYNFL